MPVSLTDLPLELREYIYKQLLDDLLQLATPAIIVCSGFPCRTKCLEIDHSNPTLRWSRKPDAAVRGPHHICNPFSVFKAASWVSHELLNVTLHTAAPELASALECTASEWIPRCSKEVWPTYFQHVKPSIAKFTLSSLQLESNLREIRLDMLVLLIMKDDGHDRLSRAIGRLPITRVHLSMRHQSQSAKREALKFPIKLLKECPRLRSVEISAWLDTLQESTTLSRSFNEDLSARMEERNSLLHSFHAALFASMQDRESRLRSFYAAAAARNHPDMALRASETISDWETGIRVGFWATKIQGPYTLLAASPDIHIQLTRLSATEVRD